MKALFIINDPPYGTDRVYNALSLDALAKHNAANEVTVFLMADAVLAAKGRQKTSNGFYNVEGMLKRALAGAGRVLLCGTCIDARGIEKSESHGASATEHHGRVRGRNGHGGQGLGFCLRTRSQDHDLQGIRP